MNRWQGVWRTAVAVRTIPGMPYVRVVAVAATAVILIPATAGTALAKSGKQTVSGTVKWSFITTTADTSDPSDPFRESSSSTTMEEHTLQIDGVRDPRFTRTYVFKPGKAKYTYSQTQTRVTRAFDSGQLSCDTTTQLNATGAGPTDASLNIFGTYKPNRDVLVIDKRTKGISVQAVLPATGTETTTIQGSGLSPCQSGTFSDPVEVTGSTRPNDARSYCIPGGLKPSSSLTPLFGKWNNSKKRFDFACSRTYTVSNETVVIRVAGSLKYKR